MNHIGGFLFHLCVICSQSPGFSGSAGGMGYWTMVSFHFYEHASMGKRSVSHPILYTNKMLFGANRALVYL